MSEKNSESHPIINAIGVANLLFPHILFVTKSGIEQFDLELSTHEELKKIPGHKDMSLPHFVQSVGEFFGRVKGLEVALEEQVIYPATTQSIGACDFMAQTLGDVAKLYNTNSKDAAEEPRRREARAKQDHDQALVYLGALSSHVDFVESMLKRAYILLGSPVPSHYQILFRKG